MALISMRLRAAAETPAPQIEPPLAPPRDPPELNASPLVILQSCHSLSLDTGSRIFDLGGAAVVGSMTNIHSASGSAFIKAFCDAALYRRATAGEALRDARNYFLCLASLRAARGHKEYAKSVRAALSFRLWGDPEARFTAGFGKDPSLQPIRAEWAAPGRLRVTLPKQRLAEARSAKYTARLFPGSQSAGIVAREPGSEIRSAMPVYYFRLDAPPGFAKAGYTRVERPGDASPRAVFLADPLDRNVWIAYFPAKERSRETFELLFQH